MSKDGALQRPAKPLIGCRFCDFKLSRASINQSDSTRISQVLRHDAADKMRTCKDRRLFISAWLSLVEKLEKAGQLKEGGTFMLMGKLIEEAFD